MALHCPTSTTDVSSPLLVAQLFSICSKAGANECNQCGETLTIDSNPIYTECGCWWCRDCLDKRGPFRPWTTRTREVRLQDRRGLCTGFKRVEDDFVRCNAPIYSEYQVHDFAWILGNPRLATRLGVSFTTSSLSPPSSAIPYVHPPLPSTPLDFHIPSSSDDDPVAVKTLLLRAATACWELHKSGLELYGATKEKEEDSDDSRRKGLALEALFSRTPLEWVDAVFPLLSSLQREWILGSHRQLGEGQSLNASEWWTWIQRFLSLAVSKDGPPSFGIYEAAINSYINLPSDHVAPTLPSFKQQSPNSSTSIFHPSSSVDLNSSNIVPQRYAGSASKGEEALLLATNSGRALPGPSYLGFRARTDTHLEKGESASRLVERALALMKEEEEEWEDKLGSILEQIKKYQGSLYTRGMARLVCGAILRVVGTDDASVFTRYEWLVVEEMILFITIGPLTPSVYPILVLLGLQDPTSPRKHFQQVPILSHTTSTIADFHPPLPLNRALPIIPGSQHPGGGSFQAGRKIQDGAINLLRSLVRGSTRRVGQANHGSLNMFVMGASFRFSRNHPMVRAGLGPGAATIFLTEDEGTEALCNFPGYESFSLWLHVVLDSGGIWQGWLATGRAAFPDPVNLLAARKLIIRIRNLIGYVRALEVVHDKPEEYEILGPILDSTCYDYVRDASSRDLTSRLEIISRTSNSWTA